MTVGRYLLRRVTFALLLVLVVSSSAVLLTLAAPGDFAIDQAGFDEREIRRRRQELGLDRPWLVQYADWLARAARLDFGQSLLLSRPVADLVSDRARNTALLALTALVGATAIGIPLGIYTGTRRRGFVARTIRALSVVVLSTPPLVASLVLVVLAARTGWLPVGGMTSAGVGGLSWLSWLADVAHHVLLPALALALPLSAVLERLQSGAMDGVAREPFVQAARARGLTTDGALIRHGWRVSLPAVLSFYGVMIGSLLSGSFVVEVVTGWPGLGRLLYDALRARDVYLVAGCAAAGAVFLALGTLLSDVLLAASDPRARLGVRR